ERARALLQNNLVEAAILEASPCDLLHEGFGCDRCDVAVVTDLRSAAESAEGGDEAEACGAVLRALAAGSRAVLNTESPSLAAWPDRSAARIVWFSQDGESTWLREHCAV